MGDNKEKVIREFDNRFETGYYNDRNEFILHSFDDKPAKYSSGEFYKIWYRDGIMHREWDKPAIILHSNNLPDIINYNGTHAWYYNGNRYWFIENKRYTSPQYILKKFKDKIIKQKRNYTKWEWIHKNNIDYIDIKWNISLIVNDTDRNEVIIRYG